MLTIRAFAAMALGASLMFQSWAFVMPHQDPTDILILVNKQNKAPAVPMALVRPDVPPTRPELAENTYMRPEAASALEELFAGALEDDIILYATSGFRSYSTQKAIYDRKRAGSSDRTANASVAKPGQSEHQTGLAMDVEGHSTLGAGLVGDFGKTPEGMWLAEHCHEYGFIIRYPEGKTHITGYIYEPWHIRYVGKEAAAEIAALDVTFEEYILMIRGDRVRMLEEGVTEDETAL